MDTLVEVVLPNDMKNVEHFIPSHVLLPRCSGLHSGKCGSLFNHNQAKKCVSNVRHTLEVKVQRNAPGIDN